MFHKRHLLLILLSVIVVSDLSFASSSRIEAMGKLDDFFIDDMSIFKNPANMVIYPTYLIGELGTILYKDTSGQEPDTNNLMAGRDPNDPWFGGVYSYTLIIGGGSSDMDESQIKRATLGISFGAAFNRTDRAESMFCGIVDQFNGVSAIDTVDVGRPINEFDLLLAFKSRRQFGIGLGFYRAGHSKEDKIIENERTDIRKSSITSVKFGINKLFSSNSFLDIHLIMNFFTYKKDLGQPDPNYLLETSKDFYKRMGMDFRFRTFVQTNRRIQLVPLFKLHISNLVINENTDIFWGNSQFGGGLGFGLNHKGPGVEFTMGLSGNVLRADNYMETPAADLLDGVRQTSIYTEINLGIEKKLKWDWLYVRAGAKKVIGVSNKAVTYNDDGDVSESSESFTNADANGTLEDVIGIGLGVNVQEHLKIDLTVAEDLPYRFGHFISGLQGSVTSRVSVGYQF